MNDLYHHALSVFLGFFAIMNPIANTTVFMGLTGQESNSTQNRIAFKSLTVAFIIILSFALFGKAIFHFFGITLPALRITGGVLVFLIGYRMLQGESSNMHTREASENTDIAISPLGIPILAGPGTIATAMNYSAAGGWSEIVITMGSFEQYGENRNKDAWGHEELLRKHATFETHAHNYREIPDQIRAAG